MLTAISLSDKLGDKGLVALSLHPGVIMTNLGTHLDWNTDWPALSKFKHIQQEVSASSPPNSSC